MVNSTLIRVYREYFGDPKGYLRGYEGIYNEGIYRVREL